MYKSLLAALVFLLPGGASAAMLAVCDGATHEVTITNGGASRTVTMTPDSGNILEYGPLVSFQLKDQHAVVVQEPQAEYCIWHNRIDIQRLDAFGSGGGGTSLR